MVVEKDQVVKARMAREKTVYEDGCMAHLDDNKPYETERVEALSFFVKMSFHRLKSVVSCWWRSGQTGRVATSDLHFSITPDDCGMR